jgi:hypothetical protein
MHDAGVKGIIRVYQVKTGMLTTRSADGRLHSRAMTPASRSSILPCYSYLPDYLTSGRGGTVFIVNRVTHKCDHLDNDPHINASFYDPSTTNWAS